MRLSILIICLCMFFGQVLAKEDRVTSPEFDQMLQLKVNMKEFTDLAVRVEGALNTGAKPDWQKAETHLIKMKQLVFDSKTVDADKRYRVKLLEADDLLSQLSRAVEKKDEKVGEAFNAFKNACLNCHTTHRATIERVNL